MQSDYRLDTQRYRVTFATGRFSMRDSLTGIETDLTPAQPGRLLPQEAEKMVNDLKAAAQAARTAGGSTSPGIQTDAARAARADQLRQIRERELKIHPRGDQTISVEDVGTPPVSPNNGIV